MRRNLPQKPPSNYMEIKRATKTIGNALLDIIFPKFCLGCGRESAYICKDCEVFLSEVLPSKEVVSVWEYEGIVEKAIWKIKFDGCYDIVGELIEKAFGKIELNLPADTYITYVPMYIKKEKQRGFNQAELIAKKAGEKTNRPVVKLLEKIKDNRSQVGLGPKERMENVRGVFRSTCEVGDATTPQVNNVFLVDDVYTTGATMQECIKILKKAGVKNVHGFTLARKMTL